MGKGELALELGVAFGERKQLAILRVVRRLPPGLLRLERRRSARLELLAPCREMGAVDALLAKERLDRAPLAARPCGGRCLDDPPFLGRRERPTPPRRGALDRGSAYAAIMLLLLGISRQGTSWKLRWLGHVGTTILRPSVHRFRLGTVSRDVGTEGALLAQELTWTHPTSRTPPRRRPPMRRRSTGPTSGRSSRPRSRRKPEAARAEVPLGETLPVDRRPWRLRLILVRMTKAGWVQISS